MWLRFILTDNLVVGEVTEEVTGALMHTSLINLRPGEKHALVYGISIVD